MTRSQSTYAFGTLALGATLLLAAPVRAENSLTIDPSTQPHLKSWSNIIPNANRRFIVLGDFNNAAVLDRETGLVWEQSPSTTEHPWVAALVICADKTVGGRKGWRLPSFAELASLVDPSAAPGPTLPVGHPFTYVESRLGTWAATEDAVNPASTAWGVFFGTGDVGRMTKDNINKMWCVRSPMNASAY